MISTKDLILWLIKGLAGISLAVCIYFVKGLVENAKAQPTEAQIVVLIDGKLEPLKEKQHADRERVIRLEQVVISFKAIADKLDGMDDKLDQACQDIAVIKAQK